MCNPVGKSKAPTIRPHFIPLQRAVHRGQTTVRPAHQF